MFEVVGVYEMWKYADWVNSQIFSEEFDVVIDISLYT